MTLTAQQKERIEKAQALGWCPRFHDDDINYISAIGFLALKTTEETIRIHRNKPSFFIPYHDDD